MKRQSLSLTIIAIVAIAGLLWFNTATTSSIHEEVVENLELTPEEWRERELAHKKKRRQEGYSKMDNPDMYFEYHAAIRTPEGETRSAYPINYRLKELAKARSLRPANTRLQMLDWISRGPNNVPGRTRTILPLPNDPLNTWVIGAVGGGIWKSTDGGQSWLNKSADFPTLAISSLATSESDPSVIYAGTGELVGGSRPIVGDGIFKSLDAGETWTQLSSTAGSSDFRSVTRVIVDPDNPDIVLVSSAENFWDSDSQSQIMRSTDGGESWAKVFQTASSVEQIVFTPGNFDIQYATVNGIGVIKSLDGGLTWNDSFTGMQPSGRIEMDVSPVNPNRLFASAEGSLSGNRSDLYVSNDAGATWELATDPNNTQDFLGGQGGYDNTLMADPYDEEVVYYGGVNLWRSTISSEPVFVDQISISVEENGTTGFWDVFPFSAPYFRNGMDIGDSPKDDFVSVEIRFGPGVSQMAHRFTVPTGSTSGVEDGSYTFQDYIEVPFEVWDTDNNRQLMVSFRDQGKDGTFELKELNTSGSAETQSREYLFIHSLEYDPAAPSPELSVNGGQVVKDLYFIWPILTSGTVWTPDNLPVSDIDIQFMLEQVEQPSTTTVSVSDAYGQFTGINRFPQNTRSGIHPDHHYLVAVKVDEDAKTFKILGGNDGGIYVSKESTTPGITDGDWSFSGYGYVSSQFYGADKKPGANEYIGGMQDNGTWKSPVGVESLANTNFEFSLGGDGFQVLWNRADPQKVIGGSQFNGFGRTLNDGQTWSGATSGLTGNGPFFSKLEDSDADPDLIYTVTSNGIFKSENFGGNWTLASGVGSNFNGSSFNVQLDVSEVDPNIVWTGAGMTINNRIYVSTNGGSDFQETSLFEGPGLGVASGFTTHPVDPGTAYALFSFSDKPKILRTTDFGQSWEDISGFGINDESSTGFPDVAVYSLLVMPYDPSIIWVGTDIGLFESTDGGLTWHIADNGFPAASIWQMKVVDDQIVVATHGRGIWSLTLPELSAVIPKIEVTRSGTTPKEELIAEISVEEPFDSLIVFIDDEPVGLLGSNSDPVIYTIRVSGLTNFGNRLLRIFGYREGEEFKSFTTVVDFFDVEDLITTSYVDEFDVETSDFLERGIGWEGPGQRITSAALHSEHPYSNNKTSFALLKRPLVVSMETSKLFYEDIALVEPGDAGSVFGTPEFKDYVAVEGSLDGMNWITIEDGYDASLDTDWENAFSNFLVFERDELFRNQSVDLTNSFTIGDTVFIRFSLVADNQESGYGWVIDNLYIQEEPLPLGLEELEESRDFNMVLYPNPVLNKELNLEYYLNVNSAMNLQLIDFSGRIIQDYELGFVKAGRHLLKKQVNTLPAGTYLIRLNSAEKTLTQRIIIH